MRHYIIYYIILYLQLQQGLLRAGKTGICLQCMTCFSEIHSLFALQKKLGVLSAKAILVVGPCWCKYQPYWVCFWSTNVVGYPPLLQKKIMGSDLDHSPHRNFRSPWRQWWPRCMACNARAITSRWGWQLKRPSWSLSFRFVFIGSVPTSNKRSCLNMFNKYSVYWFVNRQVPFLSG